MANKANPPAPEFGKLLSATKQDLVDMLALTPEPLRLLALKYQQCVGMGASIIIANGLQTNDTARDVDNVFMIANRIFDYTSQMQFTSTYPNDDGSDPNLVPNMQGNTPENPC
jgi:hypothetical protein